MKKKILITICDQCPNKDREDGWCFIVERHVGSPIPEDCELRDAEDDENKYVELEASYNALREAVAWEREAETAWYSDSLPLTARALHELHENFTAARAEVDRLIVNREE